MLGRFGNASVCACFAPWVLLSEKMMDLTKASVLISKAEFSLENLWGIH